MMDATTIPANTVSFRDYLFKDKRNRTILILAAVAMVIQWGVFKWFYPFASYIHGDSFSYINAADRNLSINTYLIGYSKFLRLFSVFSRSDYVLTSLQYVFIQSGVLFLLFTIFYFYKPGRIAQVILLCFMILNPLLWHLANLISSDGFFLALSMIWFTLLLWLIHRPSKNIIIWHAIVLLIAFTVRYNAIIYPIISLVAFYISRMPIRQKLIGYGSAIALCGLFILFTSYQYKKLTGYWQYAPFSGWQMTNNAMYAFRYVDSADRKPVPAKYAKLDQMIREYFDSTRNVMKHPQEMIMASTAYMWSKRLTLYKYSDSLLKNDSAREFKKWAMMGPFYKSYGLYMIKKYPLAYTQYFIWPNANKYFAPPVEFLETYNTDRDTVVNNARLWFGYASKKVITRTKDRNVHILQFYPILSGIINVVFVCSLICFLILLRGHKTERYLGNCILLVTTLWFVNAGFTIFASSAALRFQSFPILTTTIFSLLLIDWLNKMAFKLKLNDVPYTVNNNSPIESAT